VSSVPPIGRTLGLIDDPQMEEVTTLRALVVYFSRTGKTRKVGDEIAAALGADVEELRDDVDRNGPVGFIRSGREAKSGKLVQLQPLAHDPSTYDLVVVGTPVWARLMSSPVRTYLAQAHLGNARVAWFCTLGAESEAFRQHCFKTMTDATGRMPVATAAFSAKDMRGDRSAAVSRFVARMHDGTQMAPQKEGADIR
jgi:menaquinone-dependent protoporphyrinogen IX oxidase